MCWQKILELAQGRLSFSPFVIFKMPDSSIVEVHDLATDFSRNPRGQRFRWILFINARGIVGSVRGRSLRGAAAQQNRSDQSERPGKATEMKHENCPT